MPEGQKKASAEGQSPSQELEEGPRSGPHLLVSSKIDIIELPAPELLINSFESVIGSIGRDTEPVPTLSQESFQSLNRSKVEDTAPPSLLAAHSASLSQNSCQSLGKSLEEDPSPAPSISHKSFHSLGRSLVQGVARKALVPDTAPATYLSQQSFQSLGKSPGQDTAFPPSLSQQSFQSASSWLRKKPRLMSGQTFKRLQAELSLSSDSSSLRPSEELQLDQLGQEKPLYEATVKVVEGLVARGKGTSKKLARGQAAANMLAMLKKQFPTKPPAASASCHRQSFSKKFFASGGAASIKTDLHSLLLSSKYADISLLCQGQTYHCHKAILASRSPVLDKMMASNKPQNKMEIRGMAAETLEAVLEFLYTGEVKRDVKNKVGLMEAALTFQLQELINITFIMIKSSLR